MQLKHVLVGLAATLVPAFAAPTLYENAIKPRGFFQLFPNLIINVNPNAGDQFFSSGYSAEMSAQFSTAFSFDVPYDFNPTCTLKFELPAPGGLFRYDVEGSGTVTAIAINGVFTTPTSYNAIAPLLGAAYGSFVVSPTG